MKENKMLNKQFQNITEYESKTTDCGLPLGIRKKSARQNYINTTALSVVLKADTVISQHQKDQTQENSPRSNTSPDKEQCVT